MKCLGIERKTRRLRFRCYLSKGCTLRHTHQQGEKSPEIKAETISGGAVMHVAKIIIHLRTNELLLLRPSGALKIRRKA